MLPSTTDTKKGGFTLTSLLRLQVVLVVLALLMRAGFWAVQLPASTLAFLGLTLVLGNVANLLMTVARPRLESLPAPWNWIATITLLAATGAVLALAGQVAVYSMHSGSAAQFQFQWTGTGVRLSVLLTVVVSVLIYGSIAIYTQTKARLEAKNVELQGQVQFGKARQQAQDAELESAHEIQMHLLPRETPQLAGFRIACAWQPAKSVGGDYFDVFPLSETKMALVLADVSGKGIGAALLMANLQASVKAFAVDAVSPSELCSRLNQTLCSNIAPGKFVTMFYGILDAETRRLHYENAGHFLPLIVRVDGTILMPASYSGVLGLFSHWMYQDNELQLESGDSLLILTDGVLEAADAEEEEYGYQRLIALVQAQRGADGAPASAHTLRKAILEDVSRFCEGVFQDDASLIVVTVD